jgi:hypothetical protein
MAGEDVPGGASPQRPSGPPPGRQAPPPEKKKARGRVRLAAIAVAVGLLVVLIIILVAKGSKTQVEEATITSCGPPTAIGVVYVQGEVDNASAGRSDYSIEVAVESPAGKQIGTGTASVQNVEPDQNAVFSTITNTSKGNWVKGSTCKVLDVKRDASP